MSVFHEKGSAHKIKLCDRFFLANLCVMLLFVSANGYFLVKLSDACNETSAFCLPLKCSRSVVIWSSCPSGQLSTVNGQRWPLTSLLILLILCK